MTTYIPVTPGVNLTRALDGGRLTKKWVRDAMRDHPEWDWRNLGFGYTYVNGSDAAALDLTLQVMRDGTTVCMVTFKRTDDSIVAVVS